MYASLRADTVKYSIWRANTLSCSVLLVFNSHYYVIKQTRCEEFWFCGFYALYLNHLIRLAEICRIHEDRYVEKNMWPNIIGMIFGEKIKN